MPEASDDALLTNASSELTYEIELKPGEKLSLPESLTNNLSPGHWVVSIRKLQAPEIAQIYDAFLNSYAPEDEGLYDDY